MSLRALLWVMEDAPVESHTDLVVLYALAERAHDDGTASWPSQEWIAHRARCSDRTVRRALASLEERGIIRRGDQRLTAHLTLRRKPVVWDLDLSLKRSDSVTGQADRISKADTGDIKSGHHGSQKRTLVAVKADTAMSDKPSVNRPEPSIEPREDEQAHPLAKRPTRHTYSPEFGRFWSAYPRKVGDKKKAEGFFGEQIAEGGVERIVQSAEEFRDECLRIGTAQRYIPYPATWLNQQRWKNAQYRPAQYANLAPIGSISASMTGDDEVFEMPTFKELE